MPSEENKIVLAIGLLQSQVTNLTDRIDQMAESSIEEHRKVHAIVAATSESMRNIARDVAEMKPHVEGYKMKASSIDEAVTSAKEFKVEQAEKRGADRFKTWIIGLIATAGGIIAVWLGKIFDWLTSRPHVPVIVILVTMLAITKALAHSWYPPDCCSDTDCKPVACHELVETRDGYLYGGVTFSKANERPSRDRRCHVCIFGGKGLCVFTLQGS